MPKKLGGTSKRILADVYLIIAEREKGISDRAIQEQFKWTDAQYRKRLEYLRRKGALLDKSRLPFRNCLARRR